MIVEVHGAGFVNKGAALMLHSVASQLRKRIPQVRLAADPFWGMFYERAGQQLLQVFPSRGSVLQPEFRRRFFRQRIAGSPLVYKGLTKASGIFHERLGLVGLHQIAGLVDISGFLFSSQWGDAPSAQFADLAAYYKSKNKKVILMPQTFGPFESAAIRKSVKKILSCADLVCARDSISMEHLVKLDLPEQDRKKILLTPDLTIDSVPLESLYPFERTVCLVPNARMVDRGKIQPDLYFNWMRSVLAFLLERKVVVQMAYHETSGEDEALVRRIWPEGLPPEVVRTQKHNPENVKKILGSSWMTIGSRYHALAGALSCGVPAIGFGWAHKYEGLFRDFGCPELYFTPEQDVKEVLAKIDLLLNRENRLQYQQRLLAARKILDHDLENLWQRVTGLLSENKTK